MIENGIRMNRKAIKEDRIAICPNFGCTYLERVKPLKLGFLGFRKYPKCPKHKISLVFIEEFVGDFLQAVNACLYDASGVPPASLMRLLMKRGKEELSQFINIWMYSNPIGRGAQIISKYMDGLSRGFMKELSRKQKKYLKGEKSSKKRYEFLRNDFKKITNNYAIFVRSLYEKYEVLYNTKYIRPLSSDMKSIIHNWLKEFLKTIQTTYNINEGVEESLPQIKEKIDMILHAGTCSVILGKVPKIVIKGLTAFELFSSYFTFSNTGLCKELTLNNLINLIEEPEGFLNISIESLIKEQEFDTTALRYNEIMKEKHQIYMLNNIKVTDFKQKVLKEINTIVDKINVIMSQKEFMKTESIKILNDHILRAEKGVFTIPKNANIKKIASTIIYTFIGSTKNISKVNISKISGISQDSIAKYYVRYFKQYYPRINSNFYKFKSIRKKIALYFFKLIIENREIEIFELVSHLKDNIQNQSNFCDFFFNDEIKRLNSILSQDQEALIYHFYDLAEIMRYLILTSEIHLEIKANLTIKYLAVSLEKKGITLGQKFETFRLTLLEIYDYLKESKYSEFLPIRSHTQESLLGEAKNNRYNDHRRVIGYRIKLYAIENIYNGKYANKYKCPYCDEEGFKINTDISRLKALEFHHEGVEKEHEFTASNFYKMYTDDPTNIYFLKDLIKRMESEKVILICRNHHRTIFHNKIIELFQYLINWEELFSLPAELIHIIIRTSIENFHETRNLSNTKKNAIKDLLVRALKKRFILEYLFKDNCPMCEEFNIKQHLGVFDFCHLKQEEKLTNASDLYQSYDCKEILKTLEKENGMYMCSNCHTATHNTSLHLLKEIYKDEKIANKVLNDYKNISKKFTPIKVEEVIRAPLHKILIIDEFIERLIITIYKFSKHKNYVTSNDLVKEFHLTRSGSLLKSIRRKETFLAEQIIITLGKGRTPTKFSLTEKGFNTAKLILHFRDYYKTI